MTDIDYKIVRSEDATQPRIDVDIHQTKVVLPVDSQADPEEIIADKEDWIKEKQAKFREFKRKAPERTFEEGEPFLFLGEEKQLSFEPVPGPAVTDSRIQVPEEQAEQVQDMLAEFYREKARAHIVPRIEQYQERMNVDYNTVAFRNQRTLWGSCSPKKTLSFNWRLVMAPPDVIDYVVVHELAHLKEKNHTKRFWRIVDDHHPDYKSCSEWLEENAPRMIFTRDDL